MALDADETTAVFEIFGLPQGGSGFAVGLIATIFGPSGQPYTFTQLVTELNTKLTALTASQQARVQALITKWNEITAHDPLYVRKSGDDEGVFVDYEAQRQNIRDTLGDIVGFVCPFGGFTAQLRNEGRTFGLSR